MSLATRCVACGTVFRVVEDQLKVSEGWVRCGRCHEVFNALEGLFDLDRPSPRGPSARGDQTGESVSGHVPREAALQGAMPAPAAPSEAPPATVSPAASESAPTTLPPDSLISTIADTVADSRSSSQFLESPSTLGSAADSEPGSPHDFADARFNTALLADAELDSATSLGLPPPAATPQADTAAASAPDVPNFLRSAERAAQWRRPRVRFALSVGAVLLLGMLAWQVALQFHDDMAARWTGLRGTLEAVCGIADCAIDAPRALASVSVESSGLSRMPEGNAYRLSVLLRNRAEFAVALPSVDLTLTDPNGQLVARKVLQPVDFGVSPPALPAQGETPLQVLLAAGSEYSLSGYTIEIFYP